MEKVGLVVDPAKANQDQLKLAAAAIDRLDWPPPAGNPIGRATKHRHTPLSLQLPPMLVSILDAFPPIVTV